MKDSILTKLLGIEHPIIMAPMFLVSNLKMTIEALNAGITAAIPAANYKSNKEFNQALQQLRKASSKPFGVNLIVNKTNKRLKEQLKTVINNKVDFVITSLGNPSEVIKKCHINHIKVFCDVVDLKMAKKVEQLGADGLIAVNSQAGGHPGKLAAPELIPLLKDNCSIPVISAGGIATSEQYKNILNLGADGVSIGTPFIASLESDVSENYKKAIIKYNAQDIIITTKMSGSALNVINTEYVKKIGTKANFLERLINNNPRFKKLAKILILIKGTRLIEKAAFSATYKTVWVAGTCINSIHKIKSVNEIIQSISKKD